MKQLTVTNNDSHRGISLHLKSTLFFSLHTGRSPRRRKRIPFSPYRTFSTLERSVCSCEEHCRHCFLPVKYMSAIMSERSRPESKGIFPFARVLLMFSSSSLLNSGLSARLRARFVLATALDAFHFIRAISCS